MKFHLLFKVLPIALCISLGSCSEDQRDWHVDTSEIRYDPEVYRFDLKMANVTSDNVEGINKTFKNELGAFYVYYLDEILHAGHPDDPTIGERIVKFVEDSAINASFQSIKSSFNSVMSVTNTFTEGMKRLKYHFEDVYLPDTIVFYHSLFTSGVLSTQTQLAVGIEMYLGENDPIVQLLPTQNFPKYFKAKMDAHFLPVDMARSWIENHLYAGESENRLVDIMVEKGKVLYLLHAIYPDMEEYNLIRYFSSEWEWAKENEYLVWKYLVDQKYIFSNNPNIHRNMMSDGPFTPGLPEGAPSKLGEYMGYQIVGQFMEKNKDISLKDLIDIKNAQRILNAYEVEE